MSIRSGRASSAMVDVVVVVGSLAAVLTLLDESFWSRDYLVAGLVPVAFLLAAAYLLRGVHEGVWIYLLVAIAAYSPLGALAALRRPGPWILPTFDTMTRVLGETYTAPELFVSTLPPVEASGTVMLLPYAIGFGAALPAAWLALATSRPLAPVVPLVAALGATIPVAVLVPDHYVLRGVALTVMVMGWVAARARRAESVVRPGADSVVAAVAATAVVAAVSSAVGVLVPDDDQTDRVRLAPSGSSLIAADAAASIVPPGGDRTELFRVRGAPDGAWLRFGALDLYDGTAWVPADESPGAGAAGTFRRVGAQVAPLHVGPEIRVRVRIRPDYASDWLPTLGELTSLELDYRDGRTQLDDVRYNQATSSAVVLGGVDPRDDYVFTSMLTSDGVTGKDVAASADSEQRQPEGAFLDRFLVPFDRAELRPVQRVLLLARYLRLNGETRLSGTSSQEPIDLGLRLLGAERIAATPFQYSAVMALGAARLGVPARVVVGAEPGRGGVVSGSDVLSWVELQREDGTWGTLDPDRYTGVHLATGDEEDQVAREAGGWVRRELDLDDDEIKIPKGADITLSPDAAIDEDRGAWQVVGLVVGGVAVTLLLVWLAVPGVKVLRRRRRAANDSRTGLYVGGWQEVLDAARDLGTPVPEWWGRVAQATALGSGVDLARRADAAVFAPAPGGQDEARTFWDDCQRLRLRIVAEADARHQWWALLNPASLLAGWARRRGADSGVAQVRHEDRRTGGQQPARA